MQVFLDSAVIDEVREAKALGILDGVTTNPTLALKAGRSFEDTIKIISELVGGHGTVSAETVSLDADGMVREAELVTSWASNVVAKIPCTLEGLKAVKRCSEMGIRTNVTLIFSPTQALLAMKAGAFYVSPFVGRLDDVGQRGMGLVEQLVQIKRNYGFSTQVLAASIRHPLHVLEAAMASADIVTAPFTVVTQLLRHPLTEQGLDRFLEDWGGMPSEFKPF